MILIYYGNFKNIEEFYKDIHTMKKENIDIEMFYLSEEELKENIQKFYTNFVLKTTPITDIRNWFKELNETYFYASLIGVENIFKDSELFNAMDNYIEKIEEIKELTVIDDFNMTREIKNEKVKLYRNQLNNKILIKYYEKVIKDIQGDIKNNIYDTEKLEKLFTIYIKNIINFDQEKIINKIRENKFFIPNLNNEINYEVWGWTHKIWSKAQCYLQEDENFKKCVKDLLNNSTKIGRYRIEGLNKQYNIKI